ncbi:hypothetical protein YC2023_019344 [Brassica napus]
MVPLSGSGLIQISSSPPPPSKDIQTHTHTNQVFTEHTTHTIQLKSIPLLTLQVP